MSHLDLEWLYIPPTRFWEYDDFRPGKMGDGGVALDTDQHRVLNSPDRGPAQGLYEDLVYRLRNGQIVYLMETAYVQPEPVSMKRGRVERIDVDIVETRVDADQVEFSFDRRTHLPVRILIQEKRLHLPRIYRLSDYRSVGGIRMPSDVRLGDKNPDKNATTYAFDVDYDESIFRRGSVRFEKNGWMKRD